MAEVDRIMQHAKPAAVVMTTAASQDAAAHAETLEAVEKNGLFGSVHVAAPFDSNPDADLSDVAVLLYTTGTTGDPKGVMLTHDNVRFGGRTSANLREMVPEDVIYGVLPITHVFGLCSVVTACCYAGAQVRMEARFSAAKLFAALNDGVTLLSAVPQMHALLMQYTKEQGLTTLGSEQLRYVSSGAAPLDPAWKRKAEAFYGVALQNGYGMTESTAGICATRNPLGTKDISVGPPLPGVEVRIDQEVPGGGEGSGEVLTRGAHVMKGYYRNHQSAVIGRMVAGDEQVLAFVQVADMQDVTPEELRAFVAGQLTGYKRPSRIILGTQLPAAPTGKILKHKLLEAFAQQLADADAGESG
jgi:acyl-CoA synthetase (AMP-forming)/AMP-acid ligase II